MKNEWSRDEVFQFALKAAIGAHDLCGSMQGAIRDTFADYGMKVTNGEVGQLLIKAHETIKPSKW